MSAFGTNEVGGGGGGTAAGGLVGQPGFADDPDGFGNGSTDRGVVPGRRDREGDQHARQPTEGPQSALTAARRSATSAAYACSRSGPSLVRSTAEGCAVAISRCRRPSISASISRPRSLVRR